MQWISSGYYEIWEECNIKYKTQWEQRIKGALVVDYDQRRG